jgi:hypothetical protein
MDSEIVKVYELLENGYFITSNQMKFVKEDSQDIVEHLVTFKKRDDIQVIISKNSREFSDFIAHLKKRKDKFDNSEFVFVKELKKSNKLETPPQKLPFLKDYHKLKISGRTFSEGILTTDFKPSEPNNKKITGTFWVNLEKNPNFKNIDFKDALEVYDNKNKPLFRGFVKNYQYTDTFGIIEAQDISLKLEHEKVSAEFIDMIPVDIFSIIAKSQDFSFNASGVPYDTNERDFVIIIPVQNLISDEPFKIGDVDFYQIFDSVDDSIIRKSERGRTEHFWNGNFPRAKTIVKATNFFDAILRGYNTISKAIDVIALRTDISFPSVMVENCQHNFQFSYYKLLSKVKIPTVVYCREMNSQACTFFNIESIRESILSLNIESQKFFEEVLFLCNHLLLKAELTREEKNQLQVLHWLRRAIQEGNNKDKFLDLWVAFEFLIAGEKTKEIFSEEEKLKLRNMIDLSEFNDSQQLAINSKINMINDRPLMEKFNNLIEKLKIEFSKEELEILKNIRNKRTDLIHGKKDIFVNDEELNKMRTILEKLFIGKINATRYRT